MGTRRARRRADGAMSFAAFDVLELNGQMVMREPWRDRRKRLADIFEDQRFFRIGVVPVTDDVAKLYELWAGVGGEGIVVKEPDSIYQPGICTTAWLKLKPKLTLDAVVAGGSSEPIRWGDWGLAVELQLCYRHPRDGSRVEIEQAVRVRRNEPSICT